MNYDDAIASLESLIRSLRDLRDRHIQDHEDYVEYCKEVGDPPPHTYEPLPDIFCAVQDVYGRIVDPVFEIDIDQEPYQKTSFGGMIVDKPHKETIDGYAVVIRLKTE